MVRFAKGRMREGLICMSVDRIKVAPSGAGDKVVEVR